MSAEGLIFPVIDLFAGPGGLGEGFASYRGYDGQPAFESVVSIEQDENSFETLHLRHFLRACPGDEFPDEYYDYLNGSITLSELHSLYPEAKRSADTSAFQVSLGPENHDHVRSLIESKISGQKKWVLVGGPPCQAYSLVGRSRMMGNPDFEKDERHFLYREYLKIIADHAPPVFVMENVKGLLSSKVDGELVIEKIITDLSNPVKALTHDTNGLRYTLFSLSGEAPENGPAFAQSFLVRSEDFGVPQARHRMFIVGVRQDIALVPQRLSPHVPPTVRQTIGDLPKIRSGISKSEDNSEAWCREIKELDHTILDQSYRAELFDDELAARIKETLEQISPDLEKASSAYPGAPRVKHRAVAGLHDDRLSTLVGHEARSHMPSDLRRYAFAAAFASLTGSSPKLSDFPSGLLPDHKNVEMGTKGKMFSDRFRVQLPDGPSTTITSHISKDGHYYIHYDPTQCRSLTVREAARLQTFPDNYKFQGPRTSQYHQVGNAVPPYLARQIAHVIAQLLDDADE